MTKWLVVMLLLISRPGFAGDGLNVREWLVRPGVKLLAVEFYASWCGPCTKAVPQWKALHEKYRDQGLRLVVVSVQDPDGACVNPGWNPDDLICDSEGRLAEAWKIGDRLPAAFLWSWTGRLLVRKGHVDEVERAVMEELARLPRVTLDDDMTGEIRQLIRTELARTGKVDVVAGPEEDRALAAIRRRSYELQFSDSTACRLGERLAANSLLKASLVTPGNSRRLLIQLFSAETGCLNASAGVSWNDSHPELSIAEALDELVGNIRVELEHPGLSTQRKRELHEPDALDPEPILEDSRTIPPAPTVDKTYTSVREEKSPYLDYPFTLFAGPLIRALKPHFDTEIDDADYLEEDLTSYGFELGAAWLPDPHIMLRISGQATFTVDEPATRFYAPAAGTDSSSAANLTEVIARADKLSVLSLVFEASFGVRFWRLLLRTGGGLQVDSLLGTVSQNSFVPGANGEHIDSSVQPAPVTFLARLSANVALETDTRFRPYVGTFMLLPRRTGLDWGILTGLEVGLGQTTQDYRN